MKTLKRHLAKVEDVEIEICLDAEGRQFVRHHLYWKIAHGNKNPDPVHNAVVQNLRLMANNRLSTVKWAGYDFRFERVSFDDGMEVETVLLPLKMFEDFICFQAKNYRGEPPDNECTRLGRWLKHGSLEGR